MSEGMILDGKKVANEIYDKLKVIIENNHLKGNMKLVIITTGDEYASKVYVRSKVSKCNELGIVPFTYHYDFLNDDSLRSIFNKLKSLNYPPFIIQLPITGCVSRSHIYDSLLEDMVNDGYGACSFAPAMIRDMDVDGLISRENLLYLNDPEYLYGMYPPHILPNTNLPCTPLGIMTLLDYYKYFDRYNKIRAVILGRSDLVGKPLEKMLMDKDCTVTVCHSKTAFPDMMNYIDNADIIISTMGNTNILTYNNLHYIENSLSEKYLVDVGINRDDKGNLRGDCDPTILPWFKAYTPVPGGVGPMTVAMLMCNVVKKYQVSCAHDYAGAIPYVYPSKYTPKFMEIYK